MPILFFHGGCNAMTGQIFDLSCKRQTFSLEHNFGKFIVSYWMNSMVVNDGYDLHFKYHSPNWSTIWANSAQNIQTQVFQHRQGNKHKKGQIAPTDLFCLFLTLCREVLCQKLSSAGNDSQHSLLQAWPSCLLWGEPLTGAWSRTRTGINHYSNRDVV